MIKMKVLIDTNILIYREDDSVIQECLSKMFRLFNSIPISVYIHPASLEDIRRDKDQKRHDIIFSKTKVYPHFPNPPDPFIDQSFIQQVGPIKSENDRVDIRILYALYREGVDYLITEDMGIHKRASQIGIGDRVFSIYDSLDFFNTYIIEKPITIVPPSLQEKYLHEIKIEDPIFNTLRMDYPGFDAWFASKATEHRKCFAYFMQDDRLGAILIYKSGEDEYIDGIPPLSRKKRFKIATMKVTYIGQKIGELLLKLSIDMAIKDGCEEVYLTHFDEIENDRLVALIEEYGFMHVSTKKDGEKVYLKRIFPGEDEKTRYHPLQILQKFYPSYYDGKDVKKWIIPIRPEYHDQLFTDYPHRQSKVTEFIGEFIVEGNTIKKAYISHANVKKITPGDILLFYRSQDQQRITTIGVVEKVEFNVTDADSIRRIVGKRTVFTSKELKEMKKPVLVIMFKFISHIPNPVLLSEVNLSFPQTISHVEDNIYQRIKDIGRIDGRFTIN